MALISYRDWLQSQEESTATSREFAAAARGLMPSVCLVKHGMGSHRTEPLAAKALKRVKIAHDPNTLKKRRKRKKRD